MPSSAFLPPPPSTLFPYTTLFRSALNVAQVVRPVCGHRRGLDRADDDVRQRDLEERLLPALGRPREEDRHGLLRVSGDDIEEELWAALVEILQDLNG